MMEKKFEILPHTADLKMRVFGKSLSELFCNALYGMFMSIEPHLAQNAAPSEYEVMITSGSLECLLVDFLAECLYLSDVHNEVYLNATIHALSNTSLQATIYGQHITGFAVVEIKAVTYHDLNIKKVDDEWQATLVFDI
ncbi:MAG: archease [Candidatus Babeliaceae bacterium]